MLDIKKLLTKILSFGVFKDSNNDISGIRNITQTGTLTGGTGAYISNSGAVNTFFRAKNTTQGQKADVSFGVGDGGTNHGVYSHTMGRWLIAGGKDSDGKWKTYFSSASDGSMSQLPYLFQVTEVTKAVTVPASSSNSGYASTSQTKSNSGYYPLGVVGFDVTGTGTANTLYLKSYLSARSEGSCTCYGGVKNVSNTSVSATLHWWVLWIKFI